MDRPGYEARRPMTISRRGGMRFGLFYVADPDAIHPAYLVRLKRSLMRKGRSREDAEDLIQEAMLRRHVYAKGHAVLNEEAFLRHAVHNLVIDQYRRDRFGATSQRVAGFKSGIYPGWVCLQGSARIPPPLYRSLKFTEMMNPINERGRE